MTGFSRSPRLNKGALVLFATPSSRPKAIIFQINPESLSRTLKSQSSGGEGDVVEAFRLKGPPIETISLEIEIDATDQLEFPKTNENAVKMGIKSQLSALELMLYPSSSTIISNSNLASSGAMEIVPAEGPLTIFVWGINKVLPVQVTDFKVTEEAHDTRLNPTRAKVSIGLRVISYGDLKLEHPASSLFLAHQIAKEWLLHYGMLEIYPQQEIQKFFEEMPTCSNQLADITEFQMLNSLNQMDELSTTSADGSCHLSKGEVLSRI